MASVKPINHVLHNTARVASNTAVLNDTEAAPSAKLTFREGTLWMTAYQRNNKSKGQKNLRCFPTCTETDGHQKGFCGRQITVDYSCKLPPQANSAVETVVDKLVCFAQFLETDQEGFSVGETISRATFHDRLRTPKRPLGPFIEGEREDQCILDPVNNTLKVTYGYNRELKGWHYGFQGSKRTRNMFHTFTVYLCEQVTDSNGWLLGYKVITKESSPRWQIFCRRRKTAPIPVLIQDKTQSSEPWKRLVPKSDRAKSIQLGERKPLSLLPTTNNQCNNHSHSGKGSFQSRRPGNVKPHRPKEQPLLKLHRNRYNKAQTQQKAASNKENPFNNPLNHAKNQGFPSPLPQKAVNNNYPFTDSPMFGTTFQSPVSSMKRHASQRDFCSPRTELTGEYRQKRNLFRQDKGEAYPGAASQYPLNLHGGQVLSNVDTRFDQLKQLLCDLQIPTPRSSDEPGAQLKGKANDATTIARRVLKFLRHCQELSVLAEWQVPFHYTFSRETRDVLAEEEMPHTERQIEYALFLIKQPAFLDEVNSHSTSEELMRNPPMVVTVARSLLGKFTGEFSKHLQRLVAEHSDDEFTSASQAGFEFPAGSSLLRTPVNSKSQSRLGCSDPDASFFGDIASMNFLSPAPMVLTPNRGMQLRSPGEHSLAAGMRGGFGLTQGASPTKFLMENSPFRTVGMANHSEAEVWRDAEDQDFDLDFECINPVQFDRLSIENSAHHNARVNKTYVAVAQP